MASTIATEAPETSLRRTTLLAALTRATFVLAILTVVAQPVFAQAPVAVNDAYTARSGILLQVEAPGVLENDYDFGAEPPPPADAMATLASDVSFGVLVFNGDGSFDYTSNVGFIGVDTFSYSFVDGSGTSNIATVTLTVDGCEAGVAPTQWVCWAEQSYLAKVAELGLSTFSEGFEDDVVWGAARAPATVPSVLSQGITWASNFSFNNIATGFGAAHSGSWGVYSLPHGDQSGPFGTPIHDGFTGTASSPDALLGVGGWLVGSQIGSRVSLIVTTNAGTTNTLSFPDPRLGYDHKFYGFIDTAGFTKFEVVEVDGTVGQPLFVLGDDFSIVKPGADSTPPRVVEIGSWEDTGDGVLSEGEVTDVLISELTVRFSETVQDLPGDTDPDDVTNPANYLLFDDGGDGFDTVNCAGGVAVGDIQIPVTVWSYTSGNPSETWLEVNGGLELPVGVYRLLVCGTTSIVDWAGNALDGDGNGTGGDDFVRNFEISGPVNSAPTADPQSVTTAEDTALGITLTGSDVDGDSLTFAIATGPAHGALTGTPPSITYTPGANYHGPDGFTFTASDGALTSSPATVSITVTPTADPVLTLSDASLIEPDAGTLGVAVTISVSEPSPSVITVEVATADDSASAGLDYVAASGSIMIPALATSYDVMLDIVGDLLDEPDEAFSLTLSNPVGGALGSPSSATVTIFDNDPMAELSAVDLTVGEAAGTAVLALQLDAPSGFDITVDYTTVDGTASAPGDYGAVSGVATIAGGSTSTTVSIPIVDDTEVESEEAFILDLSVPGNVVLLTPSVQVTILDNDGCAIPGDADGNCVLDAADLSLIITIIDDPSAPTLGNADCDASGIVDGWDLVCVAESMVAQ